jgi:hypothetical protein
MDASFTILTLINGYINGEKPSIGLFLEINDVLHAISLSIQTAIIHEHYRDFEMGQVFESCKPSKALGSLTTTYTLHKYYISLLKKHERLVQSYNQQAKHVAMNTSYSHQANVHKHMSSFHSIISNQIKKIVDDSTCIFKTNPLDEFDGHRIMFETYDERCYDLLKSKKLLMDGYHDLNNAVI